MAPPLPDNDSHLSNIHDVNVKFFILLLNIAPPFPLHSMFLKMHPFKLKIFPVSFPM
jgi:hypothetical protein